MLAVTITSNFATGFSEPADLVVDGQNNLYVVSYGNNSLYKIAASGGVISGGAAGSAFLSSITNITTASIDSAGNLYVGTGDSSNSIRKYPASGGIPGNTGSILATGFNLVSDIVFGSDGYLYVADSADSKIYKLPASGGPLTPSSALASAAVSVAQQIYIDSANNLYATSSDTGKIIKFSASGGAISLSSPSDFITGVPAPYAITGDGTNFYVGSGDFGDGELYIFGASGGAAGTAVSTFAGMAPTELLWGGSNTLYATFSNGTISKLVVPAANTNPTISDVSNQSTNEGTASAALAVTVGDAETALATLALTGTSSDTNLIPNGNIVFGGSGANRTVTITPAANKTGTATITLTVTDGGGATATDTLTVTVNDVDPVISSNTFSVAENSVNGTVVGTVTATGDTNGLIYSITGGNTGNVFAIDNTGAITVNGSLNYEGTGSYSLSVAVDDEDADTAADSTATITVNLSNVNEAPTQVNVSSNSIGGSAASGGATIGTLSSVDPDTGGSHTYSLALGNGTNDADNGKFSISGSTLSVGGSSLSVGTYKILVRSTDQGGFYVNQALTITVADDVPPAVSAVSSVTADATYKIGDIVAVTVQFSEAVTVNTAGGTLQLTLETGTTDRTVNYVSGSGTNTLTFNYTVQAGDTSSDLDYVATSSLALNGGTIKDAAGNDATLTLASPGAANSLGNNKALVIDGVVPTVTAVSSSTSNGSYTTGDVVAITVTFSEVVNVIGTPQLTLETGSTDRTINYASGSGTNTLTFNYTVQNGDTSADLDYVATSSLALNSGTIKDAAGNDATLTLASPGAANSLGNNKAIVISTTKELISATYDASTGVLSVTGANMGTGATVAVNKLTLTGQGGATYTLTTGDVTTSSGTAFSVTLNATDQLNINGLLNKNGTSSVGATTYNLAGAADWISGAAADTTGNGVHGFQHANPDHHQRHLRCRHRHSGRHRHQPGQSLGGDQRHHGQQAQTDWRRRCRRSLPADHQRRRNHLGHGLQPHAQRHRQGRRQSNPQQERDQFDRQHHLQPRSAG